MNFAQVTLRMEMSSFQCSARDRHHRAEISSATPWCTSCSKRVRLSERPVHDKRCGAQHFEHAVRCQFLRDILGHDNLEFPMVNGAHQRLKTSTTRTQFENEIVFFASWNKVELGY